MPLRYDSTSQFHTPLPPSFSRRLLMLPPDAAFSDTRRFAAVAPTMARESARRQRQIDGAFSPPPATT